MKSIFPIILIVAAVGLFFFEVSPLYYDVQSLRSESAQYDQALKIADQLTTIRAELASTLNNFSPADLGRLDHFLPSHLDTVRIILDVDGIGKQDGLTLKNIKIADVAQAGAATAATPAPYNTVNLSFIFTSPYDQGTRFMKDVEQSLRLLDGVNIDIQPSQKSPGLFDFSVSLNTYWISS